MLVNSKEKKFKQTKWNNVFFVFFSKKAACVYDCTDEDSFAAVREIVRDVCKYIEHWDKKIFI